MRYAVATAMMLYAGAAFAQTDLDRAMQACEGHRISPAPRATRNDFEIGVWQDKCPSIQDQWNALAPQRAKAAREKADEDAKALLEKLVPTTPARP